MAQMAAALQTETQLTVDQAIENYKRAFFACGNDHERAVTLQTEFSAYIKTLEEDGPDYNKALSEFVETI